MNVRLYSFYCFHTDSHKVSDKPAKITHVASKITPLIGVVVLYVKVENYHGGGEWGSKWFSPFFCLQR